MKKRYGQTIVKPWLRTDSNKVIVINQVSAFQANAKPISAMLGTSNINLERFIQRFPRTSYKKVWTAWRRHIEKFYFLLCRLETSQLYKQLILKYVRTWKKRVISNVLYLFIFRKLKYVSLFVSLIKVLSLKKDLQFIIKIILLTQYTYKTYFGLGWIFVPNNLFFLQYNFFKLKIILVIYVYIH